MSKWKAKIEFIGIAEKQYQNEEIDLQEMCKRILKGFWTYKYISENPFDQKQTQEPLHWIGDYQVELEELIFECLHTIAFRDEVFEGDEENDDLTVEDYDNWKSRLYDLCDYLRIWIAPSYGIGD